MTRTSAKEKQIIFSGIQPSGKLHIGNYVGAVRNWLTLQNSGKKCVFFIADYHSISEQYDPKEKRHQIIELATELLALGLDPKKCTLFVQSEVPEHTELTWIFNTVTPVSFLERMTQFKDKAEHQSANVNMGLFDYPVLQAADILLYKATHVPVGVDQVQHVELTRDIARFFNNKFGAYFPETQPLLTETPKLRSITEPLRKMSKSHGDRSIIALSDEPEVVAEKMKRAVTEATGMVTMTEEEINLHLATDRALHGEDERFKGMAGVWNLLTMLRAFGKPGEVEEVLASQPIKYGMLKARVAEAIADHFADFRKKRAALLKTPKKVEAILAAGAKKASLAARATMKDVRKMIGVR